MDVLAEPLPEGPVSASVEPTVRNRIPVYDFIRGVAILGILPANLPWFGLPIFADSHAAVAAGRDALAGAWTLALVTGKYRSLLAMLFGIGLWLQYRKRRSVAGNWPGGYRRRILILAAIGAIHGFLIWHGDILLLYAAIAWIACFLVGADDRVLRVVVRIVAVLAVGLGAALLASGLLSSGDGAADAAGGITRAQELHAFAQGTYVEQFGLRSQMFLSFMMQWVIIVPFLLGQFVIGILLAKHRVLESPREFGKLRRRFLIFGIGVGLPLNLAAAFLNFSRGSAEIESSVEVLFGPLLALGLIMLLAMISESGLWPRAQSAVANVGRLALTSYLLQSLLATTFFYSWGCGYFGRLDRLELLGVGVGIWAFNLVFAALWLRRFDMGPVEWLWRSLAEGRLLSIRREAAA